jgi:hypothetical protein
MFGNPHTNHSIPKKLWNPTAPISLRLILRSPSASLLSPMPVRAAAHAQALRRSWCPRQGAHGAGAVAHAGRPLRTVCRAPRPETVQPAPRRRRRGQDCGLGKKLRQRLDSCDVCSVPFYAVRLAPVVCSMQCLPANQDIRVCKSYLSCCYCVV